VAWAFRDRRHGPRIRTPTRRPKWPRKKKVLPAALAAAASAHPGKRITLFFQDEARVGQKGRCCRRWWLRGERPRGRVDQRYTFAYVFAAIEPQSGRDFCLVLPAVSTEAMSTFLCRFSQMLSADCPAPIEWSMENVSAAWQRAADLSPLDLEYWAA
jgi:hypothetical protein